MASQVRSIDNTISSQWSNPDNAFTEDDQCTTAITDGDQNVYNIIGTPFTIPGGATINGIEVKVIRSTDDNDYYEIELQDKAPSWLLKTGTTYFAVCADGAQETLGSPTDIWTGSWDAAHINSSSFQIRLTYQKSAKANTPSVDHIEVVVYYTTFQQYTRFAGGAIGTAGITKKLLASTRSKTGTVGVVGTLKRLLVLTRLSTSSIGVVGATERLLVLTRSGIASIAAVAVTLVAKSFTRLASAAMNTVAITGKLVVLLRSLSASIGVVGVASRSIVFTRSIIASLSSVAVAIGEKLGGAEFTRFASASLSTVANTARTLSIMRAIQSISYIVSSNTRLAHFIRFCTNKWPR